ncbi:hypothetical protein M406DRAFT_330905 [Cryphonectria parasitica EP155]|uniref:Uncharacterized protein n=1 Tax=Cryphonectria parasitica (strain ATCC 38755 / EP155) TaxID=660469 RepID=A0A9P4Y141_CRYP1|nr:uncharacterized protein M406DRAFT_330905 [Cryphonectria parasitica EP155]KAF3764573.1 hypothetical protein M406DRAFT_330905 [Cryphonectria parasitica EP155]
MAALAVVLLFCSLIAPVPIRKLGESASPGTILTDEATFAAAGNPMAFLYNFSLAQNTTLEVQTDFKLCAAYAAPALNTEGVPQLKKLRDNDSYPKNISPHNLSTDLDQSWLETSMVPTEGVSPSQKQLRSVAYYISVNGRMQKHSRGNDITNAVGSTRVHFR